MPGEPSSGNAGGAKQQLNLPHEYFTIDKRKDELSAGFKTIPTGPNSSIRLGCIDYEFPPMSLRLYTKLSQGTTQERMNHVTSVQGDKVNYALALGWTDIARELIDLLDKDQLKLMNLLQAAQLGNLEIVKLLIEKGVDPMVMWSENTNVLVDQTQVQVITNTGKVKSVLVGGREFKGNHCLIYRLSMINCKVSLKYLLDVCIEKGFNVNDKWSWGRTPLVYSCWHGAWDNVPVFLAAGADPNIPDEYGKTPLLHSLSPEKDTHKSNGDIALLLVQHGANLTEKELKLAQGPLYQQLLQAKKTYQQNHPQN